ncbi:hypothetical protein SAMN05444064_1248 [Pseudomonas syringae]|uniref:hypothetical protein n=1 Tax=Pseudomonas syringae TaxID=317 RepID=UPI00089B509B|nr:hypothetical protein [Pseudomonas syringae]SDX52801.1 hypothetical protein SAMN05444514_1258 [Pseudomonas syringae]SFM63988.1 hypothetical protein SAMN05444064_1248 [Pseudomonas syringae]
MSVLTSMIGSNVVKACIVHDYIQIFFAEDVILNINNSYHIFGSTVKGLRGKKLINVSEGEQEIELVFEGLAKIRVDMSPDGFHGPEAMELLRPGFPLVIWD